MIDAKTALRMTEDVRQNDRNKDIWEKIENKIISKINVGKQVCICEVEIYPDSPISKNEIVERLISLGYRVTESTYNTDDLLNEVVGEEVDSSKKKPVFVYELIIRW